MTRYNFTDMKTHAGVITLLKYLSKTFYSKNNCSPPLSKFMIHPIKLQSKNFCCIIPAQFGKLASPNHCAVPILSRAAAILCWCYINIFATSENYERVSFTLMQKFVWILLAET